MSIIYEQKFFVISFQNNFYKLNENTNENITSNLDQTICTFVRLRDIMYKILEG